MRYVDEPDVEGGCADKSGGFFVTFRDAPGRVILAFKQGLITCCVGRRQVPEITRGLRQGKQCESVRYFGSASS